MVLAKCSLKTFAPHNSPTDSQGIMFPRGDVVEIYFELEGIEREQVNNLYFSCEKLGLFYELPYEESKNAYYLRINTEDSWKLLPAIATYDITLELADTNTLTLIASAPFVVLKKRNPIYDDEPDDESDNEVRDEEKG